MIIRIEKSGNNYRAYMKDLPGSPPVGTAQTPEKAVADMFFRVLHPNNQNPWTQYIDFKTLEIEMVTDPGEDQQTFCHICGAEWHDKNPACPNVGCSDNQDLEQSFDAKTN